MREQYNPDTSQKKKTTPVIDNIVLKENFWKSIEKTLI